MRGGRDFDEAPSKAFPWRGRCHAKSVTDEVEGSSVVLSHGDDWWLRPHQSQRKLRQRSRGMTATGSHKDFEFAARSTTLQGEPFLRASKSLLLK